MATVGGVTGFGSHSDSQVEVTPPYAHPVQPKEATNLHSESRTPGLHRAWGNEGEIAAVMKTKDPKTQRLGRSVSRQGGHGPREIITCLCDSHTFGDLSRSQPSPM